MANQNQTKSLIQRLTAEEYVRRLILLPFQPIISHIDDIFKTRCRKSFHQFCDSNRDGRRSALAVVKDGRVDRITDTKGEYYEKG